MKTGQLAVIACTMLFFSAAYGFQDRKTDHTVYLQVEYDGSGAIYYNTHESGKNYDIWKMNIDGSVPARITSDVEIEEDFLFYQDNSRLAMHKTGPDHDHIYTMGVDGSGAVSIYSTANSIDCFSVSPDGAKTAFVESDESSDGSLYVMDTGGSNMRSLGLAETAPVKLAAAASFPASHRSIFAVPGTTVTQNNVYSHENISFSSDSARIAYVGTDYRLRTIDLNGENLTLATTFSVDMIYWLKSGKIAFMADPDYSGQRLMTVNPDGSGLETIAEADTYDFSVSPDETRFALCVSSSGQSDVIKIFSSAGTFITELNSDTGINYVSWMSDTEILFTDIFNIYTFNTGTLQKTNLTQNSKNLYIMHSARGSTILFSSFYESFHFMDIDGSNIRDAVTLEAGEEVYDIELSPDGLKAVVVTDLNDVEKVQVINTDGSGTPVTIDSGRYSYYAGNWDPTSSRFTLSREFDDFIAEADGSSMIPVVDAEGYAGTPVFSPDGSEIVFYGRPGPYGQSEYGIYTMPSSSASHTRISDSDADPVDWKNGRILLDDYGVFYVMNPDGSGLVKVDDGYYPEFNSDATKILYRGEDKKLYVISLESVMRSQTVWGGKTKLSDYASYGAYYAWSVDGSRIFYVKYSRPAGTGKLYAINPDGTNDYDLNPYVNYYATSLSPVSNGLIAYWGDYDIWVGDYAPGVIPSTIVIPQKKGEVKVVVPEDMGTRGTINPDNSLPVPIGFKGEESGTYYMRIFNLLGELLYEESKDSGSAEGWFNWIPGDIASGIYIVHITGPGVNIHKKIPILR